MREACGPTPFAKRNVFAGSPASAWRLLIDNFTLKHIAKCTTTEAHRQLQDETFAMTIEELEVFIAVMYARGVEKKVLCLCMTFGVKNGVFRCANELCQEIGSAKFFDFFDSI